ncbi:bifunctional adenosylcobinamide kinase/adenosylcobinamide-phosphate guanylyltransferase [Yoonia sp.]|uniref:bifunctional adenosylcobinamide kinase/adenosylcobinamide-phosphate guanylyltransferase n=1 Tax=Yoonia sp. TaxID=2212373 RepID=UPI0019E8401D|nr:bifunctional adenosylcobinamide kinase/adenosylcobinamide-phosphate guanylyltransferase [Yoonia sp.]MBE0412077.1 bifunctional adenosylcobinamide kinase/adenosylcobinamide-phosphate guanylyltransferase [Yoonia sp.]
MTLPNLTLVLGGAASGKSAFAESLVLQGAHAPVYIATAQIFDDEMAAKVSRHRDQRGNGWTTIEEPLNLPAALARCTPDQAVLIDCATLWLTNVILGDHDIAAHTNRLCDALRTCPARVVIVSNEVGQGIVPDNALSRKFRNAQGTLNQIIATKADLVVAVMAGLPLVLKGKLP